MSAAELSFGLWQEKERRMAWKRVEQVTLSWQNLGFFGMGHLISWLRRPDGGQEPINLTEAKITVRSWCGSDLVLLLSHERSDVAVYHVRKSVEALVRDHVLFLPVSEALPGGGTIIRTRLGDRPMRLISCDRAMDSFVRVIRVLGKGKFPKSFPSPEVSRTTYFRRDGQVPSMTFGEMLARKHYPA